MMPSHARRSRRPSSSPLHLRTLEEANACLKRIGELTARIAQYEAVSAQQLQELTDRTHRKVQPLTAEVQAFFTGLYAFAQERRAELTSDGHKTVKVAAGEFGWRLGPSSVSIDNEEAVLSAIEELDRPEFIRVIKEINREAMLNHAEVAQAIQGVTITKHESFFAKAASMKNALKRRCEDAGSSPDAEQ